jgi:hypothetical protein
MIGGYHMNQDQKPDKDPNKDEEEELKVLLEALKNQQGPRRVAIPMGFLLHRNFMVHMALSFAVNYILSAGVFGLLSGLGFTVLNMTFVGYILGIMLFTLTENFVKILMFKYMAKLMLYSMGLLSIMVQIMIFYGVDLILTEGFHFISIEGLIVFAFIFTWLRLILSVYIRLWFSNEKIVFWR